MPITSIGTPLPTLNSYISSYAAFSDRDILPGDGPNGASVHTRDNTLVLLDSSYNLHFTNDRNTKVTIASGLNGNHYTVRVLRNTTDSIVIASIDGGDSHRVNIRTYNKPSMGWSAWVAAGGTPALSITTWQPLYLVVASDLPSWRNTGTFHIASSANISNGILVLTYRTGGYSGNDYNSTRYLGYTFNLNTGAAIANGGIYSGSQTQPVAMGGTWGGFYVYGNWYNNVANMSIQNKPYGNQFVTNSFRTDSTLPNSQTNLFNLNATTSYCTYHYFGIQVDANGTITNAGSFQAGIGQTGTSAMGPRFSSDFTSSGNTGAFTTKACQGPAALNSNNPWYFFISEIKNSKPYIYMPYMYNGWGSGWTYSTLPTGFVFDTTNACPIQWIEETQTLRVWGSNGTAVTYVDCSWNSSTNQLTWGSTAVVVAASGGSTAGVHTIGAPIYTSADVHYNTTATSTTSGLSSSYTYSGTPSIPEPYVSTLKANNGMKFVMQAAVLSTNVGTAYDGTQNYNPMGIPGTTFQFRRNSSAGLEYYNYTTGAWTSSVVNNAQSLFQNGGGYVPSPSSTATFVNDIQGTWADNTSYTYSYVFTDPNSVTVTSSTRTIATPAVQAAPTAPTPRRLFVFTLQNRTSSHVLSIENRVLINKVNLVNQSANSVGVTLNLGGYNFLSTITLAPYQTAQYETAVIANVAERLLVTCTADASVDMWIMGTEGV